MPENCNHESHFGKVYYLTGGTTSIPRMIGYDIGRWRRSVHITAEILSAHGVNSTSKVVVCHPFAPWAIGPVFTEAAMSCGASVYPLGLSVGQTSLLHLLSKVNPTHLCASARNLVVWGMRMRSEGIEIKGRKRRKAFVAGETLTHGLRSRCSSLWSADVANIYGMAEFDTVAAELPETSELVLVPYFQYSLLTDGIQTSLQPHQTGELLVRDSHDAEWFRTGDRIRVLNLVRESTSNWRNTWTIEFLGRLEESAFLADGTLLGLSQIDALLTACRELLQIQISIVHSNTGDRLRILCVPEFSSVQVDTNKILKSFLASSIDLQDSYEHGVIEMIEIMQVSTEELVQTPRGKFPRIVEREEYETPRKAHDTREVRGS